MLRDSLRACTRAHHERIERALDLPAAVGTQQGYVRLLCGFYGFYAPHEACLHRHRQSLAAVDVQLSSRVKAPKLRASLQACGLKEDELAALPLCGDLPRLSTWRHALGSLYVLEGSTLGGQIIARTLRMKLQLQADSPQLQFLLPYGTQSGAMWRSFVNALDSINLMPSEEREVVEGATQTFDALERWMTRVYVSSRHSLPACAAP